MTDVNKEREEFKFFVFLFLCFTSEYLLGKTPTFSYLPWQISQDEKFLALLVHLWRQPLCTEPTVPEQLHGEGIIRDWFDAKQIRQHGFVSLSSLVDRNVDIYLPEICKREICMNVFFTELLRCLLHWNINIIINEKRLNAMKDPICCKPGQNQWSMCHS